MTSAAPQPVMVTLAELARRKGVSKPAITKRVRRLADAGLIEIRQDGSNKLVDIAAFDRAIGASGDPAKELAAETAKTAEAPAPSSAYRDAQTEKAQIDARRAHLDLMERLGKVVPTAHVEAAMVRAAEAIVREIDRMPSWASDLMLASNESEAAVRRALRDKRDALRSAIADALAPMVAEARSEDAGGIEIDID